MRMENFKCKTKACIGNWFDCCSKIELTDFVFCNNCYYRTWRFFGSFNRWIIYANLSKAFDLFGIAVSWKWNPKVRNTMNRIGIQRTKIDTMKWTCYLMLSFCDFRRLIVITWATWAPAQMHTINIVINNSIPFASNKK